MRYLSARQISEQYSFSMKSARNIINEIRTEIESGRYPEMSILDGCGVRVKESVVTDYIYFRRALKDPVARQYVQPYKGEDYAKDNLYLRQVRE